MNCMITNNALLMYYRHIYNALMRCVVKVLPENEKDINKVLQNYY